MRGPHSISGPIPGVTVILRTDPLKSVSINHVKRSSPRIIDAGTRRRPAIGKDVND
jgi:hypothetical protein